MSESSIIAFREGRAAESIGEFQNARGGYIRIWKSLFECYVKRDDDPRDTFLRCLEENADRLWRLVGDPRLDDYERSVLCATYDRFIVVQENFGRFVTDLRAFATRHPTKGRDHLQEWATVIENCDAEAIGFHHTSVNENPWIRYDDETAENIGYALQEGTHFEVYAELSPDCG